MTSNTQIQDRSLSWLGTGTSIKNDVVTESLKIPNWVLRSRKSKMDRRYNSQREKDNRTSFMGLNDPVIQVLSTCDQNASPHV
jgi:hypothetical protein